MVRMSFLTIRDAIERGNADPFPIFRSPHEMERITLFFVYTGSVRKRQKLIRPPLERLVPRYEQPYEEFWASLSPRERLRRAWRLRRRVPDLQALHDEKAFPRI